MDFNSFIVYNIILVLCLFLVLNYKKVKQKNVVIISTFTVLVFFTGFRYYVGNDYDGYVNYFRTLGNGFFWQVEPGFYLINYIAKNLQLGVEFVIFFYSFITFYFYFKIIQRYEIVVPGILILFVSGYLFFINDQIRQGLAVIIFLYLIKYIENRELLKYSFGILLGTLFAHFSMILIWPIYFISKINLNKYIWVILIIAAFLLYKSGFFIFILNFLSFIPIYGAHFLERDRFLQPAELGSGLGVLYWVIISIFILLRSSKIENKFLVNLYAIGVIFYLITLDYHITNRLSYYLFYIKVILFSLYLIKESKIVLKLGFVFISLLFFNLEVLLNLGKHGGFPYRTIFQKEYIKSSEKDFKK
jgi:hypothetical protein